MNVLLLALSTFPGRPDQITCLKECSYEYIKEDGSKVIGTYFYQMEPVVQVLSHKLEEEQEKLDKIVMLCSAETATQKEVVEGNQEGRKVSPRKYFEEKSTQYMNPGVKREEWFYPIEIDENNPAKGITETVSLLRKFHNEDTKMQLYLDNHGGFRGVQLMVEAVLSLLKAESIQLKNVFNVQFDGGKSIITSEDAGFKMFDFVSGINEFINYGRIDSLERYFDNEEKDDATKKILNIISGIAESIQYCNVPEFEMCLTDLTSFFKEQTETDEQNENHYLLLFYQNIKNDYGKLLDDNHDTLDEIEWCLKKGFYQQGLTLVEGKMPIELYNKGVLIWNDQIETYAQAHCADFEEHVFFFNWITGGTYLYCSKAEKNSHTNSLNDYLINKMSGLLAECESEDQLYQKILSWNQVEKLDKWKWTNKDNEDKNPVPYQCNDKKRLYAFLVLHKALKTIRNKLNHASLKKLNIPMKHIEAAMKAYVNWGRELLQ